MPKNLESPLFEVQSKAALNLFRATRELDFSDYDMKNFLRDTGISKSVLLKILDSLAEQNLLELRATRSRIFINLTNSGKQACLRQ